MGTQLLPGDPLPEGRRREDERERGMRTIFITPHGYVYIQSWITYMHITTTKVVHSIQLNKYTVGHHLQWEWITTHRRDQLAWVSWINLLFMTFMLVWKRSKASEQALHGELRFLLHDTCTFTIISSVAQKRGRTWIAVHVHVRVCLYNADITCSITTLCTKLLPVECSLHVAA